MTQVHRTGQAMIIFILGLLIFFLVHGLSMYPQRKLAFSQKLGGVKNYRMLHGLVALLGLGLIVYGWNISGYTQIYTPPKAMKHIALTGMIFAFILGVSQFFNGYIKAKTKFPLLLAVKLWAMMHLLANGDLNGIIFFALFLAWAGMVRVAKKREAAKLANENAPTPKAINDVYAVVLGLVLYGAGLMLHPIIIGVAVLPH